jgi:hypothetical protein
MKKLMVLELRKKLMEIFMKANLKMVYIVAKEYLNYKMETFLKGIG